MKNPFERREVKRPEPAEGDNVVNLEQPVIIARDSYGNPIGTAKSSLEAETMRGEAAEDMRQAA